MIRLSTAVGERIIRARVSTGLTATQLQSLRLSLDGVTMTTLATALGLSKSTLTSVVDQLVSSGMVVRQGDLADRRRQVVEATDRGRDTLAAFDAMIAGEIAAIVGALSPQRQHRLVHLLSGVPAATRPIPLG